MSVPPRSSVPLLAVLTVASLLAVGASGPPLRLSASSPDPQVRCGEPATIHLTMQNTGRSTVRIYLEGLGVESNDGERLALQPVEGRAEVAEEFPRNPEEGKRRVVRVRAGQTAVFQAVDPQASISGLGRQRRTYRVYGDAPSLAGALPDPPVVDVELAVQPSELMMAAWKARTPEEVRGVLPDFVALLKRGEGGRHDTLLETTLRYMASSALPLLDAALRDDDPHARASALSAYGYAVWAVGSMSTRRRDYGRRGNAPTWMRLVPRGEEEAARNAMAKQARKALDDSSPRVRAAAVRALGSGSVRGFVALTKEVASDPAPAVRVAMVECLEPFMGDPEAAGRVADAATDPDAQVRSEALHVLETSTIEPSTGVLADLLPRVRGEAGLRVIAMLRQHDDERLPGLLEPGFGERTPKEQEAILTALAAHSDETTLGLVRLGLRAAAPAVQRVALMRLLQFPADEAQAALEAARSGLSPDVSALEQTVGRELQQRRFFPFLVRAAAPLSVAPERKFPAEHGMLPLVSPDGRWVAYQDSGGSRPGGAGGLARSSVVSLVHVVRADGTGDRIVSDMYLRGWLADSTGICSSRDGFAVITDLDGNPLVEFGEPYTEKLDLPQDAPADWRQREMRQQSGTGRMPHKRALLTMDLSEGETGESAAFSPDGKWFGPLSTPKGSLYLGATGSRRVVLPGEGPAHGPVAWAPAADRIVYVDKHLLAFNFDDLTTDDMGPAQAPPHGRWAGDPAWRPWDRPGKRLTFVRDSQVCICDADGRDARQLTFDSTPKRQPVFSPDGYRVAYVAYPPTQRPYAQAPDDIWVVDIHTGLAVRITAPDGARTEGLDWMDGDRLIYDRLGGVGSRPSLYVADLGNPATR